MKKVLIMMVVVGIMVSFTACNNTGKDFDKSKTIDTFKYSLEYSSLHGCIEYEEDHFYGSMKYSEAKKVRDFYKDKKNYIVSDVEWARGGSNPVFWVHIMKIAE